MSIPILTTDRLTIREYTLDDLEARGQLIQQAFGTRQTLDETRGWLEWATANYRQLAYLHQPPYGDYAIILNSSGENIGSVGIVPSVIPWGVFEESYMESAQRPPLVSPEFGLFWGILPAHWGRGYAGEAASAVIDFLFNQQHVRRVVATTEHDNLNSQRVMQKLGMTIKRNPGAQPFWCQVVGVLDHPDLRES